MEKSGKSKAKSQANHAAQSVYVKRQNRPERAIDGRIFDFGGQSGGEPLDSQLHDYRRTRVSKITIEGTGVVAPFAAGSAGDVFATPEPLCPADALYWAVPDTFLEDLADATNEVKQDRSAWITALAIRHACADAGIDTAELASDRTALVLGSAFAGQAGMIQFAEEVREQSARFVSPIHFPQTVGNFVSGAMARAFGIRGPNLTLASGASSGMSAIAKACALLANHEADLAVAGGFEVLSEALVAGMGGSRHGSDNGDVWSEGACVYLLRRAASETTATSPCIVSWDCPEGCDNDADTVAAQFGKSLAAESALRLYAAAHPADSSRHQVRHGDVELTLA